MSYFLAIDNGGYSTCVREGNNFHVLPSAKGMYKEMNLRSKHGDFDYILEVEGKKYMMGTLAVESKFPLEMYTDSKANMFYELSVLLAVFLYGKKDNVIMVSVPISRHNEEEKEIIKRRLEKKWEVVVNGKKKAFEISKVLVAPETVSAFWVDTPRGKTRWVDWGSRTVGYGTTINNSNEMKFINKESGTFEKEGMGAKSVEREEVEYLAEYVAGKLLALWDREDRVINIGGGLFKGDIVKFMKGYFPNSGTVNNPQTYLVDGMYKLGLEVLGNEE